jgi:hypothetical protein
MMTIALIISAYLLAGLLFVFIGPAARVLRDQLAELKTTDPEAPVRRAGFAVACALALMLGWPLFVYEAWRYYRPPTAMDAFVHLTAKALHEMDEQDEEGR